MGALTENELIEYRRAGRLAVPVAAGVTIYKGALVALAAGYGRPAQDAAGQRPIGFAEEPADNVAGGNGALTVLVNTTDQMLCRGTGFTQADVGKDAYILDDGTVGLAAAATHKIRFGKFVEYVSATQMWVDQGVGMVVDLGMVVPQELAAPAAASSTDGVAAAADDNLPALAAETEKIGDDTRGLRGEVAGLIVALKTAGVLVDPA